MCCPDRPKNATSGPRNEEHTDDVSNPHSSTNLALVTILGSILNTAHSSSWAEGQRKARVERRMCTGDPRSPWTPRSKPSSPRRHIFYFLQLRCPEISFAQIRFSLFNDRFLWQELFNMGVTRNNKDSEGSHALIIPLQFFFVVEIARLPKITGYVTSIIFS